MAETIQIKRTEVYSTMSYKELRKYYAKKVEEYEASFPHFSDQNLRNKYKGQEIPKTSKELVNTLREITAHIGRIDASLESMGEFR